MIIATSPDTTYNAFQEWEMLCYDSGCIPGEWHDWQPVDELYGADYDGNRGIWRHYLECRHCGETANAW
jgi:hypothetical protein